MSDRKLPKEYVDHGFGCPIKLRNVTIVPYARPEKTAAEAHEQYRYCQHSCLAA